MNEPKNLSSTLRDALAKKTAAQHPDVKNATTGQTKRAAPPAPKGKPVRKAAGRGG